MYIYYFMHTHTQTQLTFTIFIVRLKIHTNPFLNKINKNEELEHMHTYACSVRAKHKHKQVHTHTLTHTTRVTVTAWQTNLWINIWVEMSTICYDIELFSKQSNFITPTSASINFNRQAFLSSRRIPPHIPCTSTYTLHKHCDLSMWNVFFKPIDA